MTGTKAGSWKIGVATAVALLSLTAVALLVRQIWFNQVLTAPLITVLVPSLAILLAFGLAADREAPPFPLIEILLGGFAVVFLITLSLDLARPMVEVVGLEALFFLAAGVASGATRTGPFRRVLSLAWASIAIGVLLLILNMTAAERERENVIAAILVLAAPALIASTGYWIGWHAGRWMQLSNLVHIRPLHPASLVSWLTLALSLSFLAITPAYALDRIAFREPAFEVRLMDEGAIDITPDTVRNGSFGIEYRVTNTGSDRHYLIFYEHGEQYPPHISPALTPGESSDFVMLPSGGPGAGQFRLCNGGNGDCTVLTVK